MTLIYNNVIRLCMQGMHMEDTGKFEEASKLFDQAWNEATNAFEKLIASWHMARRETRCADQLKWYQTTLRSALEIDNEAVNAVLPSLYENIAECYQQLGDTDQAKRQHGLALAAVREPSHDGPFYHGTKADLKIGDLLTAGRISNYHSDVVMNHIYFTALVNGAGLAAALTRGDGRERVYIVKPTGSFEHDPNVTNKKFPGNLTRSYRTQCPLTIIGEVTDWQRQTPEQVQQWRQKLANSKGEIIN